MTSGGFYFARVMELCSELFFAKRYDSGCNFWDRGGGHKYINNCAV